MCLQLCVFTCSNFVIPRKNLYSVLESNIYIYIHYILCTSLYTRYYTARIHGSKMQRLVHIVPTCLQLFVFETDWIYFFWLISTINLTILARHRSTHPYACVHIFYVYTLVYAYRYVTATYNNMNRVYNPTRGIITHTHNNIIYIIIRIGNRK